MFIPLFFLSISFLSLIFFITLPKQKPHPKNPPGPKGLPIIGNLHQFDKSKPHIYLHNLFKTYGPLTYLKHGSTPIIVVNTKNIAKQILKTNDLSFCTRPPVLGQQKLAYEGIDMAFSPYNDHWKNMRKISVLYLLSQKQVSKFRPIREDEVSHMVKNISSLCSLSKTVDLSYMSMSLASNLICRVAFGKRYDDHDYEKLRFDRLLLEAQALMVKFYFSDHFPVFGWVDKLSGLLGRLNKNCKEMDVFYDELIEEHLKQTRPKVESDHKDIIDLMIQLKDDQNASKLDLTWDHIKALLMDLFVAGTDTVAANIVWSMTALMMRPEIMKKAQDEIRKVIGKKGFIDEEDVKKLVYLKAVVLEVLRMYPPAPLLFRKQIAKEDCLIEGYKIRPGTEIIINGWAIGRDPETWKNPDEFKPERFMKNEDNSLLAFDIRAADQFEMVPFGGGRRGCPGMGMGLISTELALANLLYAFDWKLPHGMSVQDIDTDSFPGLTMHKKNALVLVAKKV